MQEFDLDRFKRAQSHGVYEEALAELRAGLKQGHWIWFVFPQARGLGYSWESDYYGISSWAEARAYIADPLLMGRLVECARALLDTGAADPVTVLGGIDAVKVRSSMTLFELVSDEPAFRQVLDRLYGGERDPLTLGIAARFPDRDAAPHKADVQE